MISRLALLIGCILLAGCAKPTISGNTLKDGEAHKVCIQKCSRHDIDPVSGMTVPGCIVPCGKTVAPPAFDK